MSSDIEKSFESYKSQWAEMNARQQATKDQLAAEIAMMVAELRSGNVFVAMRIAEMNVMPTAMGSIGDNIGVSGSVDNIASNVRSMITNLQNRFNIGGEMDLPTAKEFLEVINQVAAVLRKELEGYDETEPKNSPLTKDTLTRILQGLGTMGTALVSDPNNPEKKPWVPEKGGLPIEDAPLVETNMKNWFKNNVTPLPPSGGDAPKPPSFSPEINQVTTSLQTMTGEVSSVSTTQTSRIQYLNNLFNQLQAVMSQIAQIESGVGGAMVRNMLAR